MGLFDMFKKSKQEVKKQEEIKPTVSQDKEENTKLEADNQVEVKRIKFLQKGKNYLSADGVDSEEINLFEEQVCKIPNELKKFWIEQGYGFIGNNKNNPQRLLSPNQIIDFRNVDGDFGWIPDEEFYNSIKDKGFVIMEYAEYMFFWIGTQSDNLGKIFYFNQVVCNSFDELIKKLENNERSL
jgi:antitoxin YxxD